MSGTVSALVYLRVTSLRNAVVARFLRLKEPKYLIGAIVGVLYFYLVLGRRFAGNRPVGRMGPGQPLPFEQLPPVEVLGAVLLMMFVAFYWLWPRARAALAFSEAEIAFLFPAPVSRRALIHYRWVNAQLRILFTSLLLALFSAGWPFIPGNAAVRVVGWWLIFSTLDLHGIGSSFAITRLLDRGVTSLRRRVVTGAVAAAALGLALAATWSSLRMPTPEEVAMLPAFASYVSSLLTTPPLSWLLLPAKWVVRPLLAPDLRAFVVELGPAAVVYALHYAWVLRAEVSFEEASIAKAEKRAARLKAMRDSGRLGRAERKVQRAPFALRAAGRPEFAFLWKNLLASAPYLRPRVALAAAAVVVIGASWLVRADLEPLRSVVAMLGMIGAGYTFVFGPMIARQDLRLDLPNADILKTYPLRGWQIVLGEILTPVAVITVLIWLLLLASLLTAHPPPVEWWTAGAQIAAAIAAALFLPLLCALQVLVMNAAVVLFPAWVPQGAERGRGIDVIGQRIFFVAGVFLTMALSLLPAALAAGMVFVGLTWSLGAPIVAGVAAAGIALAILGGEVWMAVLWLGSRFERFDLSAELRP